MASNCLHCGTEVPDEARFCMRCGREIPDGRADEEIGAGAVGEKGEAGKAADAGEAGKAAEAGEAGEGREEREEQEGQEEREAARAQSAERAVDTADAPSERGAPAPKPSATESAAPVASVPEPPTAAPPAADPSAASASAPRHPPAAPPASATPPVPGDAPVTPVAPARPAPLPPPRHAPSAPPGGAASTRPPGHPPGTGQSGAVPAAFPAQPARPAAFPGPPGQPPRASAPPAPPALLPAQPGPYPARPEPTAVQPVGPSPLGAFLGRALRGEWAGPVRTALWPAALLLVAALGLAIPTYGQPSDDIVVGYTDRMRILLALLLKGVGGGFAVHGSDIAEPGADYTAGLDGGSRLSLIPLTVTVLWILALYVGLRLLRRSMATRLAGPGGAAGQGGPGGVGASAPAAALGTSPTAGLEAAVRVTVMVTAAVLVLGLFAQPTVAGIDISSSPALSALGALLLSLATSCAVLCRVEAAAWLSARPGLRTLLRATGTALRALTVVLALCSVAALVALTRIDGLDDAFDFAGIGVSPLAVMLFVLPNLGVASLGLGWGAPLQGTAGGSSAYDDGYETDSFGLSELADAANDGAVVGALGLGLLCALVVGVMTARRSAGRGEQMLSAGVFFGLVLLLAAFGGIGVEAQGTASAWDEGGSGSADAGLSVPDVLLFGLLWIFVTACVAPYLMRMVGAGVGTGATTGAGGGTPHPLPGPGRYDRSGHPGRPVQPGRLGRPEQSGQPGHGNGVRDVHGKGVPDEQDMRDVRGGRDDGRGGQGGWAGQGGGSSAAPTATRRKRTVIWVAALAAAFLVGGGAAAGVLLWQDHHGDDRDDDRPTTSGTPTPGDTSQGADQGENAEGVGT